MGPFFVQHLATVAAVSHGGRFATVISAARVAATFRRAQEFGVSVDGSVNVNFPEVMRRMRKLRAGISSNDSAERFRDLGVDVYFGQASFVDSNTIDVNGQRMSFARAVIATGARAAAPPIPGLDTVDYLTNETIFSLTDLPRRLGVIGAGPIGCEMAQTFAQLGAEVLLVEAEHGILPREDRDAAEIVQNALARDGVQLLCCGRNLQLKHAGGIRLTVESHGRAYDEHVDELLVAVGRAPNVEGLNLDAVGVEYDTKRVKVNDRMQTTNRRIYAAGDICSLYQFTHAEETDFEHAIFRSELQSLGWKSQQAVAGCSRTRGRSGIAIADSDFPVAIPTICPHAAAVGITCRRDNAFDTCLAFSPSARIPVAVSFEPSRGTWSYS